MTHDTALSMDIPLNPASGIHANAALIQSTLSNGNDNSRHMVPRPYPSQTTSARTWGRHARCRSAFKLTTLATTM
ncbi:hypothetical protein B0H17DRAFT_1087346 [Mycena rosella]|uniref:Uncharacterized protein n=1 Tax=Mycena rosella TaxID=1033263 RepID=A0AAD7CXB9_MYCRO|nr:hypothetical protein B0H17DRAFT_1087346 [Mycena rosella]